MLDPKNIDSGILPMLKKAKEIVDQNPDYVLVANRTRIEISPLKHQVKHILMTEPDVYIYPEDFDPYAYPDPERKKTCADCVYYNKIRKGFYCEIHNCGFEKTTTCPAFREVER